MVRPAFSMLDRPIRLAATIALPCHSVSTAKMENIAVTSFPSWFAPAATVALAALSAALPQAVLAAPGSGPSFDCRRASSQAEKTICASPALASLDRQIAARYAVLLKQMDKPSADKLRADQKWFISSRDGAYLDRKFDDLGLALRSRLAFLNAIRPQATAGLVGKWRNLSGEIAISRSASGALTFEANAAEPTGGYWVCQATGTIASTGTGRWQAHVTDPTDARFDIEHRGTSLIVTEPGAVEYCGMNGGLAGGFFPVGK